MNLHTKMDLTALSKVSGKVQNQQPPLRKKQSEKQTAQQSKIENRPTTNLKK